MRVLWSGLPLHTVGSKPRIIIRDYSRIFPSAKTYRRGMTERWLGKLKGGFRELRRNRPSGI